jgi:myo-inositol-1-phosphate synthase
MKKILRGNDILPPKGKLGVLIPGIGAVTTTLLAGVFAARKGLARPLGSVTQIGKIRLGKRTELRIVPIKEFVPLADLDGLVFAGWDIFPDNAYQAANKAKVLESQHIQWVKEELESIVPKTAVFNKNYVKKLDGTHVKKGNNKMDLAEQLLKDIDTFKTDFGVDRLVMCWAASTEAYHQTTAVHNSLEQFEAG